MNKCIIYDEDSRARSMYYKIVVEKKFHGKLYLTPTEKGKQKKSAYGKKISGGGALSKSFKCGELGHCATECRNMVLKCYNYGKMFHPKVEYRSNGLTCFNCGE